MNQDEKNALKAIISATSIYYQRHLTDEIVLLMAEDLSDLNFKDVAYAYKRWRNSSSPFFPLPGQIRELINPTEKLEDTSRDIASKIVSAVSKFGSYRSHDAKNYIGEIGWHVVERHGGWENLCSSMTNENSTIYMAQLRDLSLSIQRISKREIAKNSKQTLGEIKISGLLKTLE